MTAPLAPHSVHGNHDGTPYDVTADLNTTPVSITMVVSNTMSWTYHSSTFRMPDVVATWKGTHNGQVYWLYGRTANAEGLHTWLLTGGDQLRTLPPMVCTEAAIVWATRAIVGPSASDF
jgi:hypothetical protein